MRELLLWLAGCTDCPMPEVTGGSPDDRAIAESSVATFYDVLLEPICVREVQLDTDVEDAVGAYSVPRKWIHVESWASSERVPVIVTHELCHGVYHQQDLILDDPTVWVLQPGHGYPESMVTTEAFARTCEGGPETLHLIGEACPSDTAGAEAFPTARDRFAVPVSIVDRDLEWSEVARLAVAGASEGTLDARATADGALRLEVRPEEEGPSSVRYVDVWSAEPASVSLPADPSEPPSAPQSTSRRQWASTVDGRSLVVFRAEASNGGEAERLVYIDDAGVTRVGCLRPGERVFATEDALWSAIVDGDTVRWGTWGAASP